MKPQLAKRTLTLMLSLAMVFSLLFGLQLPAFAEGETVINILHTNDVHGRFYQVESNNTGMIGIDKIATIRENMPNSILVDAGDAIHGLPIANINEGMNAIELMVAAGYSVMTPGNHDFNYGSDRLLELAGIAAEGGLEIISSNVVDKESGQTILPSTTIVEIDGIKVGFFGLSTLETPILTSPLNVATLEFNDLLASAESAIAELRGDGAQVVIALAHVSHVDIEALITALADKPDVVIEGHDHHLHSMVVEGVLIAGAGEYQANLGVVTITVDADGAVTDAVASLISKEDAEEIEGDEAVNALAEEMKNAVIEVYSEVVASSEVNLSSARGNDNGMLGVRNSEQALGNLVADAMRIVGGADVAVTNGGGLRADISEGEITKYDLFSVLPFGNWLTIKEVTPKELYEIMEIGLQTAPLVNGRFPQISGMEVIFISSEPALERVVSISIDGDLLDPDDDETVLTLATNNFMAAGGDGYDVIGRLDTVAELGSLDDILIEYIVENLGGSITAENAKIDGRIIESPALWAVELILAAVEANLVPQNLLSGFPLATTRAEFTSLVVALYETITGEEIEDRETFEDTEDVNVQKAAAIGVVLGVGNGLFAPDVELTREQAATMLCRLADALETPFPEEEPEFADNDSISEWAYDAVGGTQAAGIMEGVGADMFSPQGPYQRQQSIVTVMRLFLLLSVEA